MKSVLRIALSIVLEFVVFSSLHSQTCDINQLPVGFQNGLVAYYPFCGNANDASGNLNNGTPIGPILTTDRFGNSNSAYKFDGFNDYIQATVAGLPGSTRTISLWFNTPLTAARPTFLGYGGSGICGNSFFMTLNHRENRRIAVTTHCSNLEFQGNYNCESLQQWSHLVFTTSPSGSKMYINGVIVTAEAFQNATSVLPSNLFINNTATASSRLFIGSAVSFDGLSPYQDAGTMYWDGKLDDIGIWNREFTDVEINQLYNLSKPSTNLYDKNNFNPFNDTTFSLSSSTSLTAGAGFSAYVWSTGQTSQAISVNTAGRVSVAVTNGAGCSYVDSTRIESVRANIIENDQIICSNLKTFQLHVDSTYTYRKNCSSVNLPPNLQDKLVAYYPFCGNADDKSVFANHGITNGVTLTEDRFNNPSSAYQFQNGTTITVPHRPYLNPSTSYAISLWYMPQQSGVGDMLIKPTELFPSSWWIRHHGADFLQPGIQFIVKTPFVQQMFSTNPEINKWHHIVVNIDAGNVSIYTDGVQTSTFTNMEFSTMPDNIYDLIIGSVHYGFVGKMDDIMFYQRTLTLSEIIQLYTLSNGISVNWSTAQVGNAIHITPTQSAKYFASLTDGSVTSTDSVTLTMGPPITFNPLTPLTSTCGSIASLNAGSGYVKYSWSNGGVSPRIDINQSGIYTVSVTDTLGCVTTDTTYLDLLNANIIQSDTAICVGNELSIMIDSVSNIRNAGIKGLPNNLMNDLAGYFPFNGNANDESGNLNHGNVFGATLTTDRFGRPNSAYSFSPEQQSSIVASRLDTTMKNTFTYSFWVNPSNSIFIPSEGQTGREAGSLATSTCVIHPNHGISFGDESVSAGSGIYIGTNGLYVEEHSAGWEAVPLNYQGTLAGWHMVSIVYENKVPFLYIDGKFIKKGLPSNRNIYASLGQDKFPVYTRSGIGAGYGGLGASQFFRGDIDDLVYHRRALSAGEVSDLFSGALRIKWSSGDTTSKITVRPSVSTKYFVTVTNGVTTCTDSILVKVNPLPTFNPFRDTTSICAGSASLSAGTGFKNYIWNSGDSSSSIQPKLGGFYTVQVVDSSGCTASDTTLLSIVNAQISLPDTSVCVVKEFTLSVDTVYRVLNAIGAIIPSNLKNNLVAYYPFNGNADDVSVNANNGTVFGAVPSIDRFGNQNAAYAFSSLQQSSIVPARLDTSMRNTFTYSVWVRPSSQIRLPIQGQSGFEAGNLNNEACVIHPVHGISFGDQAQNSGSGLYVGTNGVYVHEHSASWETAPISHEVSLNGWHLINIVYENKVPSLYIDGKFIKRGVASPRNVYGSLGPDKFPTYGRSGIGAGFLPQVGTTQYFNGDMDNLFFHSRALSSEEINKMFDRKLKVRWSTGDTTGTITVKQRTTTTFFVTVTDGITTCTDSVTIKVDTLPVFNPLKDSLTFCGKSAVLNAGSGFVRFLWNNGSTANSITIQNGGKYKVTGFNSLGCSVSDSSFVSFADVNILQSDTTICKESNLTLALLDPSYKYKWSTGDTSVSIIVKPSTTTTYFVTTTDGFAVCKDSIKVSVDSIPNFNPLKDSLLLCSTSIQLDAGLGFSKYMWTNDSLTRTISVNRSGIYKVTVYNSIGCTASDSSSVTFSRVEIAQNDTAVCSNASYTLNVVDPRFSYKWSTGDTTSSILVRPSVPTSYFVEAFDGTTSCKDSVSITIEQPLPGIRYAPIDAVVNKPRQVEAREFGQQYEWFPSLQLSNSKTRTPTITPSKQQQYTIKITTGIGCVTIDTLLIRVFSDRNIYVPQGFTPNNDGNNDRLYPFLIGINKLSIFKIYDRWGNLLFNRANVTSATGWDGTYNGRLMPPGVYVWVAEGVDIDNNLIRRQGNFALIR